MSGGIPDFFSSFYHSFVDRLNAAPAAKQPPAAPPAAPPPAPAAPAPQIKDETRLSAAAAAPASSVHSPGQVQFVAEQAAVAQQAFDPTKIGTASEAMQQLRQSGFISGSAGHETCDFARLSGQSADTLGRLHTVFTRDAQTGRNNDTVLFGLRVAGATLADSAERQRFIKTTLLGGSKPVDSLNEMSLFLKYKKDPAVADALRNGLASASAKQTESFLYKTGFLFADTLEENGPGVDQKAIQHLPKPVVDQLIENLNKGGVFSTKAPIVSALKHLH